MASPKQQRRIERAIAKAAAQGRTITHQEARGHRKSEHKIRAERAALRAAGLPLPPKSPVAPTHRPQGGPQAPPPPPPRKSPSLTGALSTDEKKAVRAYANSAAIRAQMDDDDERRDLRASAVSWATRVGYNRFLALRTETRAKQREYAALRRAGEPYVKISGTLEKLLADWDNPPKELLYYH